MFLKWGYPKMDGLIAIEMDDLGLPPEPSHESSETNSPNQQFAFPFGPQPASNLSFLPWMWMIYDDFNSWYIIYRYIQGESQLHLEDDGTTPGSSWEFSGTLRRAALHSSSQVPSMLHMVFDKYDELEVTGPGSWPSCFECKSGLILWIHIMLRLDL